MLSVQIMVFFMESHTSNTYFDGVYPPFSLWCSSSPSACFPVPSSIVPSQFYNSPSPRLHKERKKQAMLVFLSLDYGPLLCPFACK